MSSATVWKQKSFPLEGNYSYMLTSIYMDDLENTDTILFNDLLDSFILVNMVNFPSHKLQHTLDLAIIKSEYSHFSKVSRGHMLSDHNFIHCDLTITKPLSLTKLVHYKKLKAINHSDFKVNLIESLNISEDSSLMTWLYPTIRH